MIRNVFCRCDCGQTTGYVKLPPGSILKSKYLGYVTGHEIKPKLLLTPDDIGRRRRAELIVNTYEVMKYVAAKLT
jgi:hypothetical protein